jgi:hypothetical protein
MSMYRLSPETAVVLGTSVAASTLATDDIPRLPSVFLRARVAEVPATEVIPLVTVLLERDASIADLDREIQQKGNRR